MIQGLRLKAIAITAVLAPFFSSAQQIRPASSAQVYHEIAQLNNLVNVLYVAAHPDDENTRLLAWLVNNRHIRTGYLSLTRGDGGQNLLGSEQDEALGLIRTHELMGARELDGAEQFFTRAVDFGFSKTYDETFTHWPQYQLTGDAVWVMRKFRPDVVICRFPPDTMAGHGHHAASAVIGAKAFKAVGDKMQYPAQLSTYPAWQPKRIVFNSFSFGSRSTISEDQYKLPIGDYVPGMGKGTSELAGESRSVHKSQGAGTPSVPGRQLEYFKLVDGEPFTRSLFEGIDTTWTRVGRPDIGADVTAILKEYNYGNPSASLPRLVSVRRKIMDVTDDYWRTQKLKEIDKAILDCAGLLAELTTKQPTAVRGASLPFTLRVIARSSYPVTVSKVSWLNSDTAMDKRLPFDTLVTIDKTLTIPVNADLTEPYWLSKARQEPAMYTIPADSLVGLPETPVKLVATVYITIDGTTISLRVPLSYKKLDPVKGDVVEQLRIVPDATVSFTNNLMVAAKNGSASADVHVRANSEIKNGTLQLVSNGAAVASAAGINMRAGSDTILTVPIGAKTGGDKDLQLSAELLANGSTYNLDQHVITYSHLPTLQYFTPATAKLLKPNWQVTAKRIGYIQGAGDFMPTFLRLAGLEVDVLKETDMTHAENLARYDAIITGIRAVNIERRMSYWMPVLIEYVNNGGTLIMQYNNNNDLATSQLGPYPITLSSKRVTEENARVSLLQQKHRLLTYPNSISEADFADWVQERGTYFPVSSDSKYTCLFSMSDSGEQPLNNCTLYTKYGKGNYIYTTLSFFRQLPAGNKGAIRLLMNMLSVGN